MFVPGIWTYMAVCESSTLRNWPFTAVLNWNHVVERLNANCYLAVMPNVSWLLKRISSTLHACSRFCENSTLKKYLRIWCSRCQWDYNSPVWMEVEEECGWCRGRAHCRQVWSYPLRFGICLMCLFYWHLERENVLSGKSISLEMSCLWFRLAKVRKEIKQIQPKLSDSFYTGAGFLDFFSGFTCLDWSRFCVNCLIGQFMTEFILIPEFWLVLEYLLGHKLQFISWLGW